MNFAGDAAGPPGPRGEVLMNTTTRSGSGRATGFSSTALTTEKIAVLAPIPSVSAATAARVKAGLCANMRSDCLRSRTNESMRVRREDALFCCEVGEGRARTHRERVASPLLEEALGLSRLAERPRRAADPRAEAARRERARLARRRHELDGLGNLIAEQPLGVRLRFARQPRERVLVAPLERAHRVGNPRVFADEMLEPV